MIARLSLLLLIVLAAACSAPQAPLPTRAATWTAAPTNTPAPSPTATERPPTPTEERVITSEPTETDETATVTGVIDGDTIDVNIGGQTFRVRYIGINTPEAGEACGSEATAANAALLSGQAVTLIKDVSETDQFGRLLRYVYVGDVFVNAELVTQGYAEAVEYPPDTAQASILESLERQARAANLNCYAMGSFGPGVSPSPATLPPAPTPTFAQALPTQTAPPAANCDPSYPDVCIPPPPPDLDCGDISFRRFRVLPPDPHRFDNDGDGVGCESG